MDRDGFISNGELYLVLKQMVGNNLKVRTFSSGPCRVLSQARDAFYLAVSIQAAHTVENGRATPRKTSGRHH